MIALFGTLMAQTTETVAAAPNLPDLPMGSLLLKMLIVLAVLVVLSWILLRWLKPRGPWGAKRQGSVFEILSWYRLEPKKTIYLIRMGKKNIVVGSSEWGLSCLTELKSEDLNDTEKLP